MTLINKPLGHYLKNPERKNIRFPPSKFNRFSEKEVEKSHEWWLCSLDIMYYHTKNKGEIQATKNGQFILKAGANPGFFDLVLVMKGTIFVGLELKAGKGGYISPDQQILHENHLRRGGYCLFSNSIEMTREYLEQKGLL